MFPKQIGTKIMLGKILQLCKSDYPIKECHTPKRQRRARTKYGFALFYYFSLIFIENLLCSVVFYLYRQRMITSEEHHTLGFNEVWWTFSIAWMSGTFGLVVGCLYYFCICKIDTENCNLNQPVMVYTALQK